MLFWHNQPEHLWPGPAEPYPAPPGSLLRETLPLPYLKQEELPAIPSTEPPCPPFQYVLCAATSPAVKQQEESLTYLNQGQSYEVRMLCNPKLGNATQCPQLLKSVARVAFHDRHLQCMEQLQLNGWRCSRPGDRILDIDVPLSVGVLDPQMLPSQLNMVEFHWDPTKRTSLFLQVHCISTEFSPRKKGGEKGVPFRLQIDTFKPSDKTLSAEHLHSAGCLIKVFKPKGADRKLKTDREKIEKQPLHERDKYQTACESTLFVECSPWPEPSTGTHPSLGPLPPTSPFCKLLSPERLCSSTFTLDTMRSSTAEELNPGASILETQQWLYRHRFSSYCQILANFTGADLVKLTRQDLIQICGAADGIRLFNTLRVRVSSHQKSEKCLGIRLHGDQRGGCSLPGVGPMQELPVQSPMSLYTGGSPQSEVPLPKGFYQELSLDELSVAELIGKLAEFLALPANQIHHLFHQGPGGILILLTDQVLQNLKDESYFVAVVKEVQNPDGYYLVLT